MKTIKKTIAKKPLAKKQTGEARKKVVKVSLKKAQDGFSMEPTKGTDVGPSIKKAGVKVYSGPLTERDTKALNNAYPSTVGNTPKMKGRGNYSPKAVESTKRSLDENYLRSGDPTVQKWNANQNYSGENYPQSNSTDYKKGGTVKKQLAKKTLVKKQDGGASDSDRGILTPDGRLKSRRERSVTASRSQSNASVTRTKLNGDKVTKTYNTTNGFVPSSSYTKTVTGKDGTVKSESKTPINVNKAERKTNRIINNVGRNKNDSWSMKKGGTVKKTVVKKKK